MPVDTQHPDYTANLPVWRKCRDVAQGQRAVHAGDELYLPKLDGENVKNYKRRKARALFFNATWRTIAGLLGMVFRKDPVFKVSGGGVEELLDDVTQSGIDLVRLAFQATRECLTVGRFGILVDFPRTAIAEGAAVTVAMTEALNLHPKMAPYLAESIINWRSSWINNKYVLDRVVLRENVEVQGKDEFDVGIRTQYRVLDLVQVKGEKPDDAPRMAYRVRVFIKEQKADKLIDGPFFPLMDGKPLDFLPFQFIGVDTTTPDVEEPPLVDLVDANVSHYQSTADVEHGAHKTALPQPWAAGLSPDGGMDERGVAKSKPTFYMGGGDLWMHPDIGGTFGMLEYTGTGLEAIEKRLARKEAYMAVLGARMLEDQKRAVETAETAGIHRAGEQSALVTQAKTISEGVNTALGWYDLWAGGSGVTEFDLNNELVPPGLTAQEITALVGAWQAGGLSPQELFAKFQSGGVVAETADFETHDAQIENQVPRLGPAMPAAAPPAA